MPHQKKHILAIALLFAGACKTEDYGPPPVAGNDGSSTTGTCETEHCVPVTTSADTSAGTGNDCNDGAYANYTCRGWHACIYSKAGQTDKFDFSLAVGGELYAGCENFPICIPYVGPPDNEDIYAACEELADPVACPQHPYPGTIGETWNYSHTAYIFADQANHGLVPGINNDTFLSGCSWIPASSTDNSKTQQCLGGECIPMSECVTQSCTGWQPSTHITSSTNTTTHTITATINKAWLTTLAEDMFDSVYACDDGAWTWSLAASPDKWRMQDLTSADMLYVLGFRNNDSDIKIKKYGTSTYYDLYDSTMLGGYDKMATAFGALANETHFTLSFKRGSPLQVTYTMDLTLN